MQKTAQKSKGHKFKVFAKYERGEVTIAKIRESLILEITERGYHKTNVCDLVKRAGLTRGAFYNYWSSLDECIIDLLNHMEDESQGHIPESLQEKKHISFTAESLRVIMTLVIKKQWKAGYLLLALLQEKEFSTKELQKRVRQSFEKHIRFWYDLIEADKKNKIISETVPADLTAMSITSHIGSILHLSAVKLPEFQARQEEALTYYINSLFTDSVRKKTRSILFIRTDSESRLAGFRE